MLQSELLPSKWNVEHFREYLQNEKKKKNDDLKRLKCLIFCEVFHFFSRQSERTQETEMDWTNCRTTSLNAISKCSSVSRTHTLHNLKWFTIIFRVEMFKKWKYTTRQDICMFAIKKKEEDEEQDVTKNELFFECTIIMTNDSRACVACTLCFFLLLMFAMRNLKRAERNRSFWTSVWNGKKIHQEIRRKRISLCYLWKLLLTARGNLNDFGNRTIFWFLNWFRKNVIF